MDLSSATNADIWRVANGLLALFALAGGARTVITSYRSLSTRLRLLLQALLGLLLTVVVGSIENIIQHNPSGFRTAMTSVFCIWAIPAFYGTKQGVYTRDDEEGRT